MKLFLLCSSMLCITISAFSQKDDDFEGILYHTEKFDGIFKSKNGQFEIWYRQLKERNDYDQRLKNKSSSRVYIQIFDTSNSDSESLGRYIAVVNVHRDGKTGPVLKFTEARSVIPAEGLRYLNESWNTDNFQLQMTKIKNYTLKDFTDSYQTQNFPIVNNDSGTFFSVKNPDFDQEKWVSFVVESEWITDLIFENSLYANSLRDDSAFPNNIKFRIDLEPKILAKRKRSILKTQRGDSEVLIEAINRNKVNVAKNAIIGLDPTFVSSLTNEYGDYLLEYSVRMNNVEMTIFLFENKIDLSTAKNDKFEMVTNTQDIFEFFQEVVKEEERLEDVYDSLVSLTGTFSDINDVFTVSAYYQTQYGSWQNIPYRIRQAYNILREDVEKRAEEQKRKIEQAIENKNLPMQSFNDNPSGRLLKVISLNEPTAVRTLYKLGFDLDSLIVGRSFYLFGVDKESTIFAESAKAKLTFEKNRLLFETAMSKVTYDIKYEGDEISFYDAQTFNYFYFALGKFGNSSESEPTYLINLKQYCEVDQNSIEKLFIKPALILGSIVDVDLVKEYSVADIKSDYKLITGEDNLFAQNASGLEFKIGTERCPPNYIQRLARKLYLGRFNDITENFGYFHNVLLNEISRRYEHLLKDPEIISFDYEAHTTWVDSYGLENWSSTDITKFEFHIEHRYIENYQAYLSDTQVRSIFQPWQVKQVLDTYEYNSIELKQLLENMYRYSKGLSPAESISEIK